MLMGAMHSRICLHPVMHIARGKFCHAQDLSPAMQSAVQGISKFYLDTFSAAEDAQKKLIMLLRGLGRGCRYVCRGVYMSPQDCSLLHYPDGVFSVDVSVLLLTRQVAQTAGISFFGLFSQSYM